MNDRPEEFRYGLEYGQVLKSYDTWEVDIRAASGGTIPRVPIVGPRLPEASTKERPQWVVYGNPGHRQGQGWALPIPSQLVPARDARRSLVYLEEVLNVRITINRENELEFRNTAGDVLCQLRITEAGGRIRLDTPTTHFEQNNAEKQITLNSDDKVLVVCKTARVEAETIVEVACDQIRLGDPANERVPLGEQLKAYIDAQVAIFNAHLHNPSGDPPITPQIPMPETTLSSVSKTK